jgi:hypothetical protein
MDHIGIDVHKRESQIYILAEGGEVIERRIRTEPERFGASDHRSLKSCSPAFLPTVFMRRKFAPLSDGPAAHALTFRCAPSRP